ncbi:acetyl-CoA carboxylase, carboxyltransferase subunit beta [Lachnospiraceae bacterium 46-61]
MRLFKKKNYIRMNPPESVTVPEAETPSIPDGLWIKCTHCDKIIYTKEISQYKICPNCGYHFRLTAKERISLIADEDSFKEWDSNMQAKNPMDYPDYHKIIEKAQLNTELKDAVITGYCKIGGYDVVLAVMDSHFMMASMGSVVGEKITRAIERATEKKLPIIIFTASGGARMQEGIISLMQMAKTSSALNRHGKAGLLYVSVITDPTTGGVSASFASLGDIILSEPNATIGFAGRRVIEGTINEKLPSEFQTSEFQLEHGFLDKIVLRTDMKDTLVKILKLHCQKGGY